MKSAWNTRAILGLVAAAGLATPGALARLDRSAPNGPGQEATPKAPATQPTGAPPSTPEATQAQPTKPVAPFRASSVDLKEYTSRSLARLAAMELRLRQQRGSVEDQRLTMVLCQLAEEIDPSNSDAVRSVIALAREVGDVSLVESQTRRLVELEPGNTVAQLDMIMGRINQLQTGEERLSAYERFLGPAGSSLDAGIRSRLAFEACQVHYERGEVSAAADMLKQALTLDPTNKTAAVFAVSFFTERVDDPPGRFDLLTNLLLADPADPATFTALAEQSCSSGAFQEARRFQNNARLINAEMGRREGADEVVVTTVLDWAIDGPEKVLADLNKVLGDNRTTAALTIKAMEEQLIPTSGIPKPEEITLDPALERVRALAAQSIGDEETAKSAIADIERSIAGTLTDLGSVLNGVPAAITPEMAMQSIRKLRAELASTLLWMDRDQELSSQELDWLAKDPGVDTGDPMIVTARAWKLIREGRHAEAIAALRPIAIDYTLADIGLATAFELSGDKNAAIARWRSIAKDIPLSPDGGWARSRLAALTGTSEPDPESATKIRRAAALVPAWTDEIASNPKRFLSMRAELVNPDAARLDPVRIKIVIRNDSPVALGIGAGRTIGTSVVVDAKAEVHIDQLFGALGAEFTELTRRFSLGSNQQLEVEDWAEPGFVGWMIESSAQRTVRARWRTLYGFVQNEQGIPVPGPMGLTAETRSTLRPALPEAVLDSASLSDRVRNAPESELPAALVAVRSRLLDDQLAVANPTPAPVPTFRGVDPPKTVDRPNTTGLSGDDRAALGAACAERYASCSREARIMMLVTVPHELQCAEMKAFDAIARQEKDPGVAMVAIVTRVRSANDPMLAWAAGAGDTRLELVARTQAGAIDAKAKIYANAGPGLYGMILGAQPPAPPRPANQPASPPPASPAGNR